MSDLKISQLPALSGSDLASADQLAVVDSSASQTSKLTVGDLIANGVTLINDNTIPGAKILFDSGSIATAALADSGVTTVKIAADAITSAKIADNVIVALASTLPTSGGFIGQLALDTDDNSLYVWSGTAWLNTKAPASVNAFTDTTAGIVNITTTVSSGTATITASIDNTASAAQFLAGPVGSGGTVGYRTIDGGDLPTPTTTSKGGVIVNGGGLALSTDTIQIDNSVTPSSVKHLVTYNANGLITGGSAITSSDLPTATNSAKGAVSVPTNEGLAVDASGNLSINNTVTSGTYTKVTVTAKGVVSAGDTLDAADIPDHSAAKLTSGTINTSLIANDSITAEKLANESTVKFGGALGSDNVTIFPDGDFKGQLFWDETSLDLYVYTGSAFIPITVLSGNLVNAGTYNANTNLVSSVTTAGSSAGFSAGSALPAPAGANLNHYVVVETSGTGSGAAPAVALAPPDMLLSNGVGTEYRLIDVSNAIAGQTAANISFIASGTIAATDVQAALQEVDSEKLAIAGGTMTGDLNLGTSTNVVFEGSAADDYETTLTVTNPTADRTITLPNVTGTVVTTGDTGSVTSTMIADGAIVNADINAGAEIAVSKLANGTARQLLQTDSGGSGVEFTSNVDVPGTLDVTSAATFDSTVAVTGLLSANGKLAYPAGSASAVSLYSGSDTDTGIYSPGSNQFGISTAGTSRIVVDASGNVVIGATSPSSKFHVNVGTNQNIAFNSDGSNSRISAFNDAANASVPLVINGSELKFTKSGSDAMLIDSSGRLLVGASSAATAGSLAQYATFVLRGDTTGSTSSGIINLARGVGAASMSSGFSAGNITFSDNAGLEFGDIGFAADATPSGSSTPGKFVVKTTASGATTPTTRMTIDSSGFATFSGRVIAGSTNFGTSAVVNYGLLAYNNSASQYPTISAKNIGNGPVFEGRNSANDLNIQLNSNGSAYFASNVGIGHSSPQFGLTLPQVSNDSGKIGWEDSGNTKRASITCSSSSDALQFHTGSSDTERMRIDSSGRLLVGTTTPGATAGEQLTIAGSSNAGMTIRSSASSAGSILFEDTASDRGEIQYSHNGDYMRFKTAGSERMRINSSGNIGIATTSPAAPLSVVSTSSTYQGMELLTPTGDGSGEFIFGVHQNGSTAGRSIVFKRGGSDGTASESLRISADGKVGIGSTSPADLLEIKGNFPKFSIVDSDTTNDKFSILHNGGGTIFQVDGNNVGPNSSFLITQIDGTERMRIDSSGRLLVGTTTSSSLAKLVVKGRTSGTNQIGHLLIKSDNTPPGADRGLGAIEFGDDNERIGAVIVTAAEGQFTASSHPTRLMFQTTGDGASSSTERMRISSTGVISLPQNQARFELATQNGLAVPISIQNTGNNTSATLQQFKGWNGTVIGSISGFVNQTTYATSSDYRLKENITSLIDGISRVKQLQPKRFNFIENPDLTLDGFFAHEAQQVVPNAVTGEHDEIDQESKPVYQGMDHSKLVPLLTAALQEAIAKIETLETKVAAIEAG